LPLTYFTTMIRMLFLLVVFPVVSIGQDLASMLEQARQLELKMKDEEALQRYKEVLVIQASNAKALNKIAEITCLKATRTTNVDEQIAWYAEAEQWAHSAYLADTTQAEAQITKSFVYYKMGMWEKKNEKTDQYFKNMLTHANNALFIDPGLARAWHLRGLWHLEMLQMSAVKRNAYKVLYGKSMEPSLDSALQYFLKAKALDAYHVPTHFDLARAYEFGRQYEKSIATLQYLLKLPAKRQEDANLKEKGRALLQKLQ